MIVVMFVLLMAATPASLLPLSASAPAAVSARRKHRSRRGSGPVSRDDWTLDGQIELVSDYRPGGISSTNGKPALQAEINLAHRSGLFATAWASSLAPNGGARVELDLSAGYARRIGSTTLTALTTAYVFPGLRRSAYVEVQGGADRKFGRATLGIAAAWCPSQANIGHRDNLYLGIDGSFGVKGTPVVLDAAFGRENGAFGDRKLDWSLGGHVALHRLELSLAYQDARRTGHAPHSGAALIGGIALTF